MEWNILQWSWALKPVIDHDSNVHTDSEHSQAQYNFQSVFVSLQSFKMNTDHWFDCGIAIWKLHCLKSRWHTAVHASVTQLIFPDPRCLILFLIAGIWGSCIVLTADTHHVLSHIHCRFIPNVHQVDILHMHILSLVCALPMLIHWNMLIKGHFSFQFTQWFLESYKQNVGLSGRINPVY